MLLCCIAMTAFAATEQRTGASLDQLPQTWTNDRAQQLTLATLESHRVVLTMAYSSCHRICPMVIDEFKRMQQRADARGETVEFVIVGYDPKNDSPAVWHQYRLTRRLDRENWHFLSGSSAATRELARQLGFPFWQMDEHVMHESRAVLFDAHGIQKAFLGPPMSHWADAL
jgi:protein SCO1/2